MEILSWVLEGALEHKDSLGTGSIIRPGELQRMSAGTGVRHSEWNPSKDEPVHFLQIWLLPEAPGLAPGYEQKSFAPAELENALRVIASRDGRDGSVRLNQDAVILASRLRGNAAVTHALPKGRGAWVHLAKGAAKINGTQLNDGDGAQIEDVASIEIAAGPGGAEVLLFDLA
jgi:redox-sensitive bicupin YhaK (pirin superfamily)